MINKLKILLILFFVSALCLNAQTGEEQFDKMMDYIKPNKNHEVLHEFAGKWKQNILRISEGGEIPGSGTTENSIIFGGRFLEIKFTQSYDNFIVSGIIYLGYDNLSKKFFLFGIDELGTSSLRAEGDYDKKTKTLELRGTLADPVILKNRELIIRMTKDRENKFTFEEFVLENGKERKVLLQQNILIGE